MKVRLLGPRLLVRMDPESSTFQGSELIKPDTVHDSAVCWGEVEGIGHGHYTDVGLIPVEGVKVGDRVSFIKFLKEGRSNKQLSQSLGDDMLIIRMEDVLLVDG